MQAHAVHQHSLARNALLAVPVSASACPPWITTAPWQARADRDAACAAAIPVHNPLGGCPRLPHLTRGVQRASRHKIFQLRIKNTTTTHPAIDLSICDLRLNLFIPQAKHYRFSSYKTNKTAVNTHFSYTLSAALSSSPECGFPYAHIFLLKIMWTTPLPPCRAPVARRYR